MLLGEIWVLEHLRAPKGPGNTFAGRAWAQRMRAENQTVTKRCDDCGHEDVASGLERLRHIVKSAIQQEKLYGRHICPTCISPFRVASRRQTTANPEWKASHADQPSWQSTASPEKLAAWTTVGVARRAQRLASKTPEERRAGVVRQWETMSDEVKQERARKIGLSSKARWAALSEDDRTALVRSMIKGVPRSKASEGFKQSLIAAGLYAGFQSEVGITGFIVDECDCVRKLVIEFYGDFYHCNPKLYAADWYNRTTHMTAAKKWQYDRGRLAALYKAGYQTLIVWERDWRTDSEAVLERVRAFIAVA